MPIRIAATVACLLLTFAATAAPARAGDEDNLIILSTTFPIYQFTRNLADGADQVEVRLMLPADMGCPHDYAL
ncbi:MAG: zinc ABC transporter substrate-binding protein, partial [Planctomycetes bacterium]|nr:zinc ABC transporter substrate-binding protein [Planctomycetota bacterium]